MTTSIDLVQTNFKCCSINSHLNYDMSLWRLQNYGPNFVVPKTCCILANDQNDGTNYLDPKPQNLTLCQSLLKYEYNRGRHKESCIEHIIAWYTQHYTLFLTGAAVLGFVQLFVILSVIFSCIKMHKRKRAVRSTGTTMQTNVLTNNKRPAPQPQFQQPTNNIHSKPTSITRYSYNLSNSYLVWIFFSWNISNSIQKKN